MTLTSQGREPVAGPMTKDRILDWMRLSKISSELIHKARHGLPESLDPDLHDHLLLPYGFDRASRARRILRYPSNPSAGLVSPQIREGRT